MSTGVQSFKPLCNGSEERFVSLELMASIDLIKLTYVFILHLILKLISKSLNVFSDCIQDNRFGICKRAGPRQCLHLVCWNFTVLSKSFGSFNFYRILALNLKRITYIISI